ncbi:MAG: PHP domain-containing protein [Chloroflexi bacterium]|nr:PHP domain-containing protein [Chloroflexota bacterium]
MIEVDLHLHTTFSDGRLTPTQLVRLCAERGLKVICVSDHDSTEGIREALEAAREFPQLTLIPGIELSTDVPGSEIHMLGYFVDYEDAGFQRILTGFREGREDRARGMVERLREVGVEVSWERVVELSGGGAIGRPHIAQAMVEAGYVQYPREAFDRYLGRNGVAYVERVKLTPPEAIEILLDNGALPVMAHPTYSASKSDRDEVSQLRETLAGLKAAGLVGMEVYYGDYTPQQVEYLKRLADEFELIPCGGSDYHASGNPGEPQPGTVGPPMATYEALKRLKEQRTAARR